jgi:hypothetical protein
LELSAISAQLLKQDGEGDAEQIAGSEERTYRAAPEGPSATAVKIQKGATVRIASTGVLAGKHRIALSALGTDFRASDPPPS